MLDLKRIRQEPERFRERLALRGPEAAQGLDRVLELDGERRALIPRLEELRASRNAAAQAIAQAKRSGEDAEHAIAQQRELAAAEKLIAADLADIEERLAAALAPLPNLPDPSAAPGPEDEVVRVVGEPRVSGGEGVRDHLELAGPMIDIEHAASMSGSRFAYLKGDLVFVELALVRFALQMLRAHGFEPVVPPVLVRERALFGTGFLPDTEQQIYSLPEDGLFLVGTSEVALASLHDDEILDAERLPLRYAGFSPCFRREAGAAGKDTRGIFRVHQFDKVEMFSFVAPDSSAEEHERILAIEEQILCELDLPYRVVNIAAGDLGNSAAKKYDCEVWLPSQGRYRELTSCSNTTDYQARRLNMRMRAGKRVQPLHTLNGTAVAVGRTIIALLENGQREDGTVALPAVLAEHGSPAVLGA
jgi:seryl-tRNA synthetase